MSSSIVCFVILIANLTELRLPYAGVRLDAVFDDVGAGCAAGWDRAPIYGESRGKSPDSGHFRWKQGEFGPVPSDVLNPQALGSADQSSKSGVPRLR